ncbi:TIGR03086 family protein [Nakamurella sp. YIM 132087]|uniref:TIGR03086 family protein n=1 Tax=Nakamurella alba TaxID=2665158 RepID=A0A7K1FLS0_9ACTN|nr:TIGR03086 family metal-binding protein [Nakamurella alba]MTD15056.1 TIGR03086 family protein [Nakamurella alba]
MPSPDLRPAADRLAGLLPAISDDQLDAPTPCGDWTVRDVLQHAVELTGAFTAAAVKKAPDVQLDGLPDDWRERLPRQLGELAGAWDDPAAWDGECEAGGVTLPSRIMGVVALDEIVVHGWDLAVSTGQAPDVRDEDAHACLGFAANADGVFGPALPVADDAPVLHRLLGATGRSADWSPA